MVSEAPVEPGLKATAPTTSSQVRTAEAAEDTFIGVAFDEGMGILFFAPAVFPFQTLRLDVILLTVTDQFAFGNSQRSRIPGNGRPPLWLALP